MGYFYIAQSKSEQEDFVAETLNCDNTQAEALINYINALADDVGAENLNMGEYGWSATDLRVCYTIFNDFEELRKGYASWWNDYLLECDLDTTAEDFDIDEHEASFVADKLGYHMNVITLSYHAHGATGYAVQE